MAYDSAIMVGLVGVLFFFVFIQFTLNDEILFLKILFYILSLWWIIGMVAVMRHLAVSGSASANTLTVLDTLYNTSMYTALGGTVFIIIYQFIVLPKLLAKAAKDAQR